MALIGGNINWGDVIDKGLDAVRDAVTKKTAGPVAVSDDFTPVPSTPAWVWPVAIVAGLWIFRKKIFGR